MMTLTFFLVVLLLAVCVSALVSLGLVLWWSERELR